MFCYRGIKQLLRGLISVMCTRFFDQAKECRYPWRNLERASEPAIIVTQ